MSTLAEPPVHAPDATVFHSLGYAVLVQALLVAGAIPGLTTPVWWGAIARERGYSLVMFGTLNTINAVVGFVVGTWLVVVLKRLDRRLTIVAAGAVMAIAELATITTTGPVAFYAVRSINSAALGMVSVLAMVYLGYTRNPAKSYGWYTTLQTLAQAAGLVAVPVLAQRLGFVALQSALALPGIVIVVLGLRLPRSLPLPALDAGGKEIVAAPILWAAAVPAIGAFLAFGFYTNDFFGYSERFGSARGLDPERIGLILSLTTVAGLPASLFVSWLGDRAGLLKPIVVGCLCGAGAAFLLTLPELGEAGYWAALVVFSLVWSFVLPYLLSLFARIDPVGRLLIATQPIRAAVSAVLLAGLTAAIAHSGLAAVAWLAAMAVCLCPVLVATALAVHRRRGASVPLLPAGT